MPVSKVMISHVKSLNERREGKYMPVQIFNFFSPEVEIYVFLSHYFTMFQHSDFLLNVVESMDAGAFGASLKSITNSLQ